MKSKHLGMALLFAATASFVGFVRAQGEKSEPSKPPATVLQATQGTASWGVVDPSGLQLGAWQLQAESPRVFCVIRNQGQKSVAVNLGTVGVWDYISVFARPTGDTKWQRMSWKPEYFAAEGIGPSAYKVVDLVPQQQMPEINWVSRSRYDISNSVGFLLTPHGVGGTATSVSPQLAPHTFAINLFELNWPFNWPQNVELRVEQFLWSDKQRPSQEGTLSSGVLQLRLSPDRTGRLPVQGDIQQVVLQKRTNGPTLSTEGFKQLMKTATPVSDEEFRAYQGLTGDWYGGSFSTPLGTYHFSLTYGGVNYLITPRGTTLHFKFNPSLPIK